MNPRALFLLLFINIELNEKMYKDHYGKTLSLFFPFLLWSYVLNHLAYIYCTTGKLYLLTNKSKSSIFSIMFTKLFPYAFFVF